MTLSRRDVLFAGLSGVTLGTFPGLVAASTSAARVIVVGGGFAGATCAKYLRRTDPSIKVTLIEPRTHFYTGPFSNAAIAGLCTLGDVVAGPGELASLGVEWVREAAVEVDPVRKQVRLASGNNLAADWLVVCPGVSMVYDRIQGLDAVNTDQLPHAWLGGGQVTALAGGVSKLRDGATVIISAPNNPYRCPPGPYERASLIAWRLTQKGLRNWKVLIADAKDDFTKRSLFQLGWDERYPGRIQWIPRAQGGELVRADADRRTLELRNGDRLTGDLVSVIPPQRAAAIAVESDLADETGWCPVQASSFESARHKNVFVIGDAASAHPLPKSAFCANSQAKLAALCIAARHSGAPAPTPLLVNTCYSLLAPDHAISVGGLYGVLAERFNVLSDGSSALSANAETRALEAAHARQWYQQITRDSFAA